jgi:hypothetical protein
MAYIPFDQVKRVTTIERVAGWLGLIGTRMQCPVNQGDKRELAIFPKTQRFCCFGCKKNGKQPSEYSGDLIQLAAHIKGTPVKKQALEIMKAMHGYQPAQKGLTSEAAEKINSELEHEHEAVQALGLSPERAKELGIGFRRRGTKANMVLIPVRDDNGQLLDYAGYSQDKGLRFSKHMGR